MCKAVVYTSEPSHLYYSYMQVWFGYCGASVVSDMFMSGACGDERSVAECEMDVVVVVVVTAVVSREPVEHGILNNSE